MKKSFLCIFLIVLLLFGSSCGNGKQAQTADLFAMNTTMSLQIYGSAADLQAAKAEIERLEALFSTTMPESDLSALNRGEARALDETTAELLTAALSLCERTNGALDISVYPIVRAWGFTTGEYRVPTAGELEELCKKVDYRNVQPKGATLQLQTGVQIDFGSVAKGYAADRVRELLQTAGVQSALLNLGGNIQAVGKKPGGEDWKVGIRNPFGEANDLAAVLSVSDTAVVTSGGYERNFDREGVVYHHILDPKTGYPANAGLSSVTIVAESGLLADALSTALYVMGLEAAIAHWRAHRDFEAVFITDTGALYYTAGLEGCISVLSQGEGGVVRA